MSKTLTRAQIASNIYKEVGISFTESSKIVDDVFEEIIDAIKKGEAVKIASLGSFYVRQKNKRIGRNPKTGVEAEISARKVVCFYASNILKSRINK